MLAFSAMSCSKIKRCYQCTITYTAIDTKWNVPKPQTLEVCDMNKEQIKEYEQKNTRTNSIYSVVTQCSN